MRRIMSVEEVSFAVMGLNVFGSEYSAITSRPPCTPGAHRATSGGCASGCADGAADGEVAGDSGLLPQPEIMIAKPSPETTPPNHRKFVISSSTALHRYERRGKRMRSRRRPAGLLEAVEEALQALVPGRVVSRIAERLLGAFKIELDQNADTLAAAAVTGADRVEAVAVTHRDQPRARSGMIREATAHARIPVARLVQSVDVIHGRRRSLQSQFPAFGGIERHIINAVEQYEAARAEFLVVISR